MKMLFEFERWARVVKTLGFGGLLMPFTLGVYLGRPDEFIGHVALFALGGWCAVFAMLFVWVPARAQAPAQPKVEPEELPTAVPLLEDKRKETFADRFRRLDDRVATIH
ncbi:hypothetical protein [Salipiger sp. PrR003]|uniref:hypothetical protein n=1 Tax=Salipiger sp. PrR003 TaxID=2706776 RepID=UPI0013DBD3CA|nr:hypothetical protein [Salipiger sp. PrR003]NDV50577.1 hypothetical protein [Salipiger sp. PrR003]